MWKIVERSTKSQKFWLYIYIIYEDLDLMQLAWVFFRMGEKV